MNDIINIKEKFKVDDSHSKIRGFVCAYDENGKLVFSKENMIVESGRRFILNNGINENSLKYVQLGTSGTPASPNDTIDSLNDDNVNDSIVKTDVDFKFSEDYFKTNFESLDIGSENNICLKNSEGTKTPQYFEYTYDGSAFISSNGYSFQIPSSSKGEKSIIIIYNNQKYYLLDGEITLFQETFKPEKEHNYGNYKFTKKTGDNEYYLYNGNEKVTTDIDRAFTDSGKNYKWSNSSKTFIQIVTSEMLTPIKIDTIEGEFTIKYNCITEDNHFSYFIDSDQLVINCFICFNGKESIAAKSLGIIAQYPDQDFYTLTKDTSKQSGKIYYTKSGATFTAFTGENFTAGTDYYENLKKQEVLFSRVTFPTYYKSNHQRLTFKYYIYF